MNPNNYVFDAYAILALLENEPGSENVADILNQGVAIFISTVNLGEVYYIVLRRDGEEKAEKVIQNIFLEDSITVAEASWDKIKKAASIKSKGGLSFADAFAISLAIELQAPLLTGDPEMKKIALKYGVKIIWMK